MPLFKKQSEAAKKKFQHQQYLAKESPDPSFDISGCELSDVPSGVYMLCKVLQKEALFLYNNWLTSLINKNNVNLSDLSTLRVLDLHDNSLECLPEDIRKLEALQVLHLEGNKLKAVPQSIGQLQALQTLNLRRNKLKEFPGAICDMRSLRTLDVSENNIHSVPKQLCRVQTLESLILDSDIMRYPGRSTCCKGTEEIMKFLCSESGAEYIPPSKFVLPILDSPDGSLSNSKSNHSINAAFENDEIQKESAIQQYENMKEKKRLERITLEKEIEEEQRAQASLAAFAAGNKKQLLNVMAVEQQRMQKDLSQLQQQKDSDRQKLVATLYEVEKGATELINQLLVLNEKAHRNEEILEKMERDRIEAEQWFHVREEEQEMLRKKEILLNMEKVLEENRAFEALWNVHMANKNEATKRVQESLNEDNNKVENVLMNKQTMQNEMIEQIMHEETWQKEAFEALQLQKDAKHRRISNQISLIQDELSQLTLVEVERREMRIDSEKNALEEKRHSLSSMLMQLMDERDKREEQLKIRLLEMDQRRQDTQTDYWMVQFQRLLDRKPQELIDQENQLEISVKDILEASGSYDYIPLFSRHRITIETMVQLSDDDLKQMGVHELGLRRSILRAIEDYIEMEKKAEKKTKDIEDLTKKTESPTAVVTTSGPSAPPPVEVTARINAECVICMERTSVMIFMNCGHVCCCELCSLPIKECPLCRQDIIQRIKLTQN